MVIAMRGRSKIHFSNIKVSTSDFEFTDMLIHRKQVETHWAQKGDGRCLKLLHVKEKYDTIIHLYFGFL